MALVQEFEAAVNAHATRRGWVPDYTAPAVMRERLDALDARLGDEPRVGGAVMTMVDAIVNLREACGAWDYEIEDLLDEEPT